MVAILDILKYPHKNLHKVAEPVLEVNQIVQTLISDMFDTMYAFNGIGLAATQVDRHIQVVVIDVSEERNSPLVLINPVIIFEQGRVEGEEGCLSVPGIYEMVTRAEKIRVSALSNKGEPFTLEADGLLARCVQHEIDHLKGKVFVSYLSQLKQSRIKTKLIKQIRKEKAL